MATTTPRQFDPSNLNVDHDKFLAFVEWYEEALGDSDKADSGEDVAWYDGQVDALVRVLAMLTQE